MKCKICGSYAINHHHHGRDGTGPDLCDADFWRVKAEAKDARIAELENGFERFVSSVKHGDFSNGKWNSTEFQAAKKTLTSSQITSLQSKL